MIVARVGRPRRPKVRATAAAEILTGPRRRIRRGVGRTAGCAKESAHVSGPSAPPPTRGSLVGRRPLRARAPTQAGHVRAVERAKGGIPAYRPDNAPVRLRRRISWSVPGAFGWTDGLVPALLEVADAAPAGTECCSLRRFLLVDWAICALFRVSCAKQFWRSNDISAPINTVFKNRLSTFLAGVRDTTKFAVTKRTTTIS